MLVVVAIVVVVAAVVEEGVEVGYVELDVVDGVGLDVVWDLGEGC